MQALREYEDDLCACGQPRSEAWSFENDRRNPAHVAHYETGPPFRCAACRELAKSQKQYVEADDADGAYWAVQLVPRGLHIAV